VRSFRFVGGYAVADDAVPVSTDVDDAFRNFAKVFEPFEATEGGALPILKKKKAISTPNTTKQKLKASFRHCRTQEIR